MKQRILVIDDEEAICEILKFNLESAGYEVQTALSAEEALAMELTAFNLMLVDIMMGEIGGYDFAKRVRANDATARIPIIFCSALGDEDDKVMGLNIGADDYIAKPFDISEVCARVRAVLRRSTAAPAAPAIALPDNLTNTERELLQLLASRPGAIFSREEIAAHLQREDVTLRTIDAHITRLRRKLQQRPDIVIITRSGFGYGLAKGS